MPMEEYKKSEDSVKLLREKFSQDVSNATDLWKLGRLERTLPTDENIDQATDEQTTRDELKGLRTSFLQSILIKEKALLKARLESLTQRFSILKPEELSGFFEDVMELHLDCPDELRVELLPLMGGLKAKLEEQTLITKPIRQFFYKYFDLTFQQLSSEFKLLLDDAQALNALAIRFFKFKEDLINGQHKLSVGDRKLFVMQLNYLALKISNKASQVVNIDQFAELSKFSENAVKQEFPGTIFTVRQKQLESVTVFYQKFKALDENLSKTVLTDLQACEADYVHILSDLSTYKTRAQEAVNAAQKILPDTAACRDLFEAFKIEVLQLGIPVSSKQKIQTSLEAIRGANNLVDLEKGLAFRPKSQDGDEKEAFDTIIKLAVGAKEDAYLADVLKKLQAVAAKLGAGVEACFQEYISLLPELNAAHKSDDAHEWKNPLVNQLRDTQMGLVAVFRSVNQLKSAEIFSDFAYWADINAEFEKCDDAEKLEGFATKFLKIKKSIQEMDVKGEVKNTILTNFNTFTFVLQASITDDFRLSVDQCGASLKQFHPEVDASPGIALVDRQQEMTRFSYIIDCLKTLPNTATLVTHLQSQTYLYGLTSLKEYRDEVREDIDNLPSELDGNPTWEKTLPDLMRSLFTLGMNQPLREAFLDRLVALDKIEDVNEWLSARMAQAPEGLDEEGAANWEDAVSFFYEPKRDECFDALIAQLRELEAQIQKIDTDRDFLPTPEQVKRYLDLRPQLEILTAMVEDNPDERLYALRVKNLRPKLVDRFNTIVSRTADKEIPEALADVLEAYELDAFYEEKRLGILQLKCKLCTEPEKAEKLAEEFAEAKEAFEKAELEGEEALRVIKHLNLIANELLNFVAKTPETGEEDIDLAAFYNADSYPGIVIKERSDELATLDVWLETIKTKKASLEKEGHQEAAIAAQKLLTMTNTYSRGYVQGLSSPDDFKAQMDDALSSAHYHLDKHRGWKQLLINLALAILTVGVGYLAVALYQGRFFPALHVATKSEQMLDDFEVAVKGMGAAAGA